MALVHFGIQFGVRNIDITAVEREIERQIALNGRATQDVAIARFSISSHKKNQRTLIICHSTVKKSKNILQKRNWLLEISLLAKTGYVEKAEICYEQLVAEGISQEEELRLRRIITEAKGENPIELK